MHQAAVLGGSALDALTLQQDGLPPAEINISRGQVVQAFILALVIIVLDECLGIFPPAATRVRPKEGMDDEANNSNRRTDHWDPAGA